MLKTFARAAAVAAALLCATAALAQKSFVRDDLASEGVRLEEKLKTEAGSTAAGRPAAQLRRDAEGLMSRSNQRGAMSLYAAAVALEPKNAANWVGFVKAVKAVTPKDYTERYQLRERAHGRRLCRLSARDDAPRRGRGARPPRRVSTSCSEDWRPALNAYAASLQLADEPALRKTYEELREKHGFRIPNYKVDSDSASPRVCFSFSGAAGARGASISRPSLRCPARPTPPITTEELAALRRRPEARRALRLRAAPGPAVVRRREPAEVGRLRDLCPRPLAAGALHRPQLRPAAHRPGGHPARLGQHAPASTSRSTASATATSCRRCARRSSSASSARSAAETIATEKGRKIWSGTLETQVRAQPRRRHGLPGHRGRRQARARRLRHDRAPDRARAPARRTRTITRQRATQWFVVSDLGLTAFKGEDGVHVLVRSLASAEPLAERRDPPRRPQQRGARRRKATDAAGHVAFDPGLARGEGGIAPGLVVASTGEGLRLPRPRLDRLRPHRPRREGPRRAGRGRRLSSSPSAASTAPARPCS